MDLWSMLCQPGKEMWTKDLKGLKNVTFAFLFYTVRHIKCLRWHVQPVRKNFIQLVCTSGFLQVKILLVPYVEIYFDEINTRNNDKERSWAARSSTTNQFCDYKSKL